MNSYPLSEIYINEIGNDETFSVSRKSSDTALVKSLQNSGMLEMPYLYSSGKGYEALTCHRRIALLRDLGVESVICAVLHDPDMDQFMKHVSLKTYRNEIGPSGKIKVVSLLRSYFRLDENQIREFSVKILRVPREVLDNSSYIEKFLSLPENLRSYFDEKDINFKLIKEVLQLPEEWIKHIGNFVDSVQVRVNIFRSIADFIYDIWRRGDSPGSLEGLKFGDDKVLYEILYSIRYPEYSKMKERATNITGCLSVPGLTVEFPEYFERGFITLKLDIDKKTDFELQLKKVTDIDREKIVDLLSMI